MSSDSKKRNPWRGDPPPPQAPAAGQRLADTMDMEGTEEEANLDFAVGPRKPVTAPPLAAPPVASEPPPSEPPSTPPGSPTPTLDAEEPEPLKFEAKLEDSEMDMTPMIDCVFQLLIFFMVTAAFSMQKSKQMPAPKDDKPSTSATVTPDENTDQITVFVDSYNSFRVQTPDWDEEAPSEQDLLVKLRRARNDGQSDGRTPTKLMIKAHGDALHEKVITALDAGTAVGMEQISLQTVEQDEE